MTTPAYDLYDLREDFDRQHIMVCFNGPINAALIEEIGRALRDYLRNQQEAPTAVVDIFAVYIEMTQNIRRYADQHRDLAGAGNAVIVVSRNDGHYVVSAGNVVAQNDGAALLARVRELGSLDTAGLKAVFKAQLRQPRETLSGSAGLGLIDMARKAAQPISACVREIDAARSFFSLRVVL
ncbi:biofilm regulation protein kinase SiaB [Desulfatirhabdium butyrativorans]|uniref:biofilm regulation protein kinase SiaB n=1 Tax=Desulfatirhabdium butyrativorans TaxID=340467 RepID=UPI0004007FF9|nr:biofilm regulation protein kinase SiaB [Desulfatirhabdium butyrativorans]